MFTPTSHNIHFYVTGQNRIKHELDIYSERRKYSYSDNFLQNFYLSALIYMFAWSL
jgi:hypothetical protein